MEPTEQEMKLLHALIQQEGTICRAAAKLEVSPSVYSRWLNGHRRPLAVFMRAIQAAIKG